MRTRHVFLDGDPFGFCHACNYKTRWLSIQEKLNTLEPSKRLDLLRKNLTWIMKRALIVLCAQSDKVEADNIWRKSDEELWQYWSKNVRTWKNVQAKINEEPDGEDLKRIEELCKDVMKETSQIQEYVWKCKKKDIYKKLKGYEVLLCRPREKEVVYDISNL